MRIRWTAEARSDLVRLYDDLADVNRPAAIRAIRSLRAAPGRLRDYPRLGARIERYDPREVRRLFVGDHELRYEVTADAILVLNLWHTREDR